MDTSFIRGFLGAAGCFFTTTGGGGVGVFGGYKTSNTIYHYVQLSL